MARMGHASVRAALIYQHATAERDRHIADKLNLLANKRARPQACNGRLELSVEEWYPQADSNR